MSLGFARFRAPTFADVAAGRDNNLNLLRMVAASSVLFSHSYALTGHMLEEPLVVASAQRTDAAHRARPDARQAVLRAGHRMVCDVARQRCVLDARRYVAVPARLPLFRRS